MKVIKVKKQDADVLETNIEKLNKCNKMALEIMKLLTSIKKNDVFEALSRKEFDKQSLSKLKVELMFLGGNGNMISDFVKDFEKRI